MRKPVARKYQLDGVPGAMQLAVTDAGLPECSNARIRDVIGLSLDGAIASFAGSLGI